MAGELEQSAATIRRFLGIGTAEPIELTAFCEGQIKVAHARSEAEHVRLLKETNTLRGFNGAYQLVNGPMDPDLLYRYEPGNWHKGWNGRATDRDIRGLRALFLDCDPIRPKGISSSETQLAEAWAVSEAVQGWFAEMFGDASPIGWGCSGNGYFTLVALEPMAPSQDTTKRISELLGLINKRFGTERVKIDTAVANAARLMPAAGTWKRKGFSSPERPHRKTAFHCADQVVRVPLEALA
jgi:hypothetical protein